MSSGTTDGRGTGQGRRRRWIPWVIGAVVLLVVLVVGVPFLYTRSTTNAAPPPLSVSPLPTASPGTASNGTGAPGTPSGATPDGIAGTWTATSGSQAGYRIDETLFGQSAQAVGRTSAVTGTMTATDTQVTAADITVDMASVTSDKTQRDGQFRGRIMETDQFPTATFRLTRPIDLGALPADGTTVNVSATGDLTLHGTTRPVTIPLTAVRDGERIQVSGSLVVTFADYGIDNPSGGPASVGDSGTMELLVVFTPA